MTRPMVVKFGGSLFAAPDRDALLSVAAREGVIVVPGGGPFADAVREAQPRAGFSEEAAHAMAILAMDQMAIALADAVPGFSLCATREEISATTREGLAAMWRPSAMALEAPLPASWNVTSDSLALWLAVTLGASRIVMLKAAPCPSGCSFDDLTAAGLIDPYAPTIAREFQGEIVVLGEPTTGDLDAALRSAPAIRGLTD